MHCFYVLKTDMQELYFLNQIAMKHKCKLGPVDVLQMLPMYLNERSNCRYTCSTCNFKPNVKCQMSQIEIQVAQPHRTVQLVSVE